MTPHLQDAPPSQRKQATILFADLSGFTALSETLDPEEVRALVNRYFERLAAAVHRYGGTVDKYIGDCVMAVFGVPTAHENDPERACRAALEMREGVADLAKAGPSTGTRVGLHIGINTGLVVAAPVGSAEASQFTVMGDAVNLASRLLHEAEEGEIVVGEATWAQVKDLFDFGPRDLRTIKGKADKVAVYRLEAAAAKPVSRAKKLVLAMVGRSRELGLANELLADAAARRGSLLYITGETGIGKSRLVEEIAASAQARGFRLLSATGQPFEALQPYGVWGQVLRGLVGIAADQGDGAAEPGFRAWMETQPVLAPHTPALQATLGFSSPEFEMLDEEARLRQVATAWKALLHSTQATQPLLLVLDDLQWADPLSLSLIGTLVDSLPGLSVLFCCIARPEFQHGWVGRSYYHQITLRTLSAEESTVLVRKILPGKKIEPSAEQLIVSRADGNPFYLAELALAVSERGTSELPPTIQGIIMQRVDRLEKEARQVLEAAAVIGREFPERLLRAVAEVQEVEAKLARLQQLEFIYEKQIVPELLYLFKHYLTQEATYNSILIDRRKKLHREVVAAVEKIYKESLERYFSVLAQHLEQAGEYAKAFEYYRMAGERAQQTQSDAAAIALFQRSESTLDKLYETHPGLRDKIKGLGFAGAIGFSLILMLSLGPGLYTWWFHGEPQFMRWKFWAICLGIALLYASLLVLVLIGLVKRLSFFVYPDRIRIREGNKYIDIPFEMIDKAELISWKSWPRRKPLLRNLWNNMAGILQVELNPWYGKLGEVQRLRLGGLRRYVKVTMTGKWRSGRHYWGLVVGGIFAGLLGRRFGAGKWWSRGYYLDMDTPERFLATLNRALERYRAIR